MIKPSQQAEKHLAKNYPISCRPELRQAAGRGIPRPCSQASDDAAGLAKLLRERAVQVRAGVHFTPLLCERPAQRSSLTTSSQMPG